MIWDKGYQDCLKKFISLIDSNEIRMTPQAFDRLTRLTPAELKAHVEAMIRDAKTRSEK